MKWNGYKGLWVIEGRKGYIPCIFQIQLNEGRETKAVFQGSFRLRWPSATFDDVTAEIFEKHPLGVFDLKQRWAEWSLYDIKVPRERFESIRIRRLSYRSRGTLMSYTDHSAQRRFKSNTPNDR